MKNIALPPERRHCPKCHSNDALAYYKEVAHDRDAYYCKFCYKVTEWDGEGITLTDYEAYPNRDKPLTPSTGE